MFKLKLTDHASFDWLIGGGSRVQLFGLSYWRLGSKPGSKMSSEQLSTSEKQPNQVPVWQQVISSIQDLLELYLVNLKSSFTVQVISIISFFSLLTIITVAIILYVFTSTSSSPKNIVGPMVHDSNTYIKPSSQLQDALGVLQGTTTTTLVTSSLSRFTSIKVAVLAVIVLAVIMVIVTATLLIIGNQQSDSMNDLVDQPESNIAKSPYYYLVSGLSIVVIGTSFFHGMQSLKRYRYHKQLQKKIDDSSEEIKFVLSEVLDELDALEYNKLFNQGQFLNFYDFSGEEVGRGAFGIIYKVTEKKTGKVYAVKRSSLFLSNSTKKEQKVNEEGKLVVVETPDPGLEIRRVIREALLLHSFDHKNIIKVKEVFLIGLEAWIVMEFVEKGSLMSLIKARRKISKDPPCLPEAIMARVLKDVTSALLYLHDELIIHRDLSLKNLLLSESGDVKLIDFGASYRMSSPADKPGDLIATPQFASPEFAAGKPCGRDSDIWALGISALTMGEGQIPRRNIRNPMDILKEIHNNPIPQYDRSKYSEEFNDFVDSCLTVDANDRADARSLMSHPFLDKACSREDFVKFFAN